MRLTQEQSFQLKRSETLATETTSSAKTQLVRGDNTSGQVHANRQYSFKDEHNVSQTQAFRGEASWKSCQDGWSQLLFVSRDGWTPYKEMFHHQGCSPSSNWCKYAQTPPIAKEGDCQYDIPSIRQGSPVSASQSGPILKRELKVLNIDPHHKKEKSLVPI